MIHVVVGTSHLSAIFGYDRWIGSPSFEELDPLHTELRERLRPLLGQPLLPPRSRDDLANVTVFDALSAFHEKVSVCLCKPPPAKLLVKLQRELQSFGRREYHYPAFEATPEDAYRYLAINGLCGHGSDRQDGHKVPVFLPDFSTTAPRQMIFYDRGGFGTSRVRDT
ncbi:MAG TPA: hypothetical protein VH682_11320 [Gemmataceae bacterium]|jgi:hypothetical protein